MKRTLCNRCLACETEEGTFKSGYWFWKEHVDLCPRCFKEIQEYSDRWLNKFK